MPPQDHEKVHQRRIPIALASVLAISAAGLLLAQCDRRKPPPAPAPPAAPAAPPVQAAPIAVPPPPLDRAAILADLSAAASSYAAGTKPAGADPLAGRAFAIRLAFGCSGPRAPVKDEPPDGRARWFWGPKHKTVRLSLAPQDLRRSALVAPPAAPPAEGATDAATTAVAPVAPAAWGAADGFWIRRPWLTTDGCPAAHGGAAAVEAAPSPETVGLVALAEASGSRVTRRNGRAYSFTLNPPSQAAQAPPGPYQVLLEGRLAAFPDGLVVHCGADSPDRRPVCIAAVHLDRVAFENAASGEIIAEWREG